MKTAAFLIERYDTLLHMMVEEHGGDYDNSETWASEALFYRDDIEKRWSELTETQRDVVRQLDAYLVAHKSIALESTSVQGARDNEAMPRAHWWWYLDVVELNE